MPGRRRNPFHARRWQFPSKADVNTRCHNDDICHSAEESLRSSAVAVTGIGRDGPSIRWALAAVDNLTVKTDKAKLIQVLKTDNFEMQNPSPSASLQQ